MEFDIFVAELFETFVPGLKEYLTSCRNNVREFLMGLLGSYAKVWILYREIKGENESLQQQVDSLNSEKEQINKQVSDLQGEIATLKGENSTLSKNNKSLEDKNGNLKKENDNLKKENATLPTLQQDLQQAKDDYENVVTERDSYMNQVDQFRNTCIEQNKKINEYEGMKQELDQKLKEYVQAFEQSRNTRIEQKEKIGEQEKKIEEYEGTLQELTLYRNICIEQTEKIEMYEGTLQELNQEFEQLRSDNAMLEMDLTLTRGYEAIREEVSGLIAEFNWRSNQARLAPELGKPAQEKSAAIKRVKREQKKIQVIKQIEGYLWDYYQKHKGTHATRVPIDKIAYLCDCCGKYVRAFVAEVGEGYTEILGENHKCYTAWYSSGHKFTGGNHVRKVKPLF